MVHWHAYSYTGSAYTDSDVLKGRAPSNYAPFLLDDWLLRPQPKDTQTFHSVDRAVDWIAKALEELPPTDADAFPVATRLEYTRARLQQTVGPDVVYGYYTRGRYVSRALIACPRPGVAVCPSQARGGARPAMAEAVLAGVGV